MANMAYCRWGNTSRDMADCVAATEDLELSENESGSYAQMSEYEQAGVRNCARRAVEMLRYIPIEILAEADIDVTDIPSQEDIDAARVNKALKAA